MTRHRREALLRRIAYAMVEIPRCEACGHVIDPSTASIARNRCRCRECLAPDLATRAALAAAIPPLPLDPARVRATVAAAQAFGRGVPGHRCGNHSQKDDRCTDACAAVTTKSGCVGSSRNGCSSPRALCPTPARVPPASVSAALPRRDGRGISSRSRVGSCPDATTSVGIAPTPVPMTHAMLVACGTVPYTRGAEQEQSRSDLHGTKNEREGSAPRLLRGRA